MTPVDAALGAVADRLDAFGHVAVAVSGGIDSLTLSTIAGRRLGARAAMYHAVSPAVPEEATARVRALAEAEQWRLHIIDAAEFAREDYVANPVNRCFYCKQSLYAAIASETSQQIVSGTNADDLGEYRPGLDAARKAQVRHPFVEADIGKAAIRMMARTLGLGELAELPASPCLSSRVESGIGIRAELLAAIHAAEQAVRARLRAPVVRCRYRRSGIVIELEATTLDALDAARRTETAALVQNIFSDGGFAAPVGFAPYRSGSAFLVPHGR